MTPTCSNAAMRVLISILLASSAANAAALPHQVLDARAPAPVQNAEVAAEAIQAAASAISENPTNFFDDVGDELAHRSGWDMFRDLIAKLFGPDDGEAPAEVTVTVTASAEVAVSIAEPTSTLEIILPPVSLTTSMPASEIIFSILPVGDLTSMINATVPTPIFSTPAETEVPVAPTPGYGSVAPFPVLNATRTEIILPTAASITDEFSVTIPFVTGVASPVNSTAPEGTGIALPYGGNLTGLLSNATAAAATAANGSTTIIVVTETVFPMPMVTGTAVSASASASILVAASPLWSNGSYGPPTILPVPVGTALPLGGGVILGTGTQPLPVIPLATALPLSTGIPLATGTGSVVVPTDLASPLYPNTTTVSPVVLPIPILVTGVPEPVLVNLTVPAPNVTTSFATAVSNFTQVPILVTGVPAGVLINVTLSPPASESLAAPLNVTLPPSTNETLVAPVNVTVPTPSSSLAHLTELPVIITGTPGAVVDLSVTIPSGPYANVSASPVTEAVAVSSGTGVPVASLVDATAISSIVMETPVAIAVAASASAGVPGAGTLNFVFNAGGGPGYHG